MLAPEKTYPHPHSNVERCLRGDGLVSSGLRRASSQAGERPDRLVSHCEVLNRGMEGGLPMGSLIECGAPLGQGGREGLLPWIQAMTSPLAHTRDPGWALWVYSDAAMRPYAPAWQARGVDLRRLRFAETDHPLEDLRPVFLEPFFRLIVLDTPRRYAPEEYGFVARQARRLRQIVILVRPQRLWSDSSNVWARLRFNMWRDQGSDSYQMEVLKGLSPRRLSFDLPWAPLREPATRDGRGSMEQVRGGL